MRLPCWTCQSRTDLHVAHAQRHIDIFGGQVGAPCMAHELGCLLHSPVMAWTCGAAYPDSHARSPPPLLLPAAPTTNLQQLAQPVLNIRCQRTHAVVGQREAQGIGHCCHVEGA